VSIDQTLDEVALLSQAYGGAPAITDQGSAQPILQGLRQRGVFVEEQPWTNERKVDAVAAVRRALYGGRLSIPRHRELITELVTLEQRPLPSGRPRIAAPGRAHDDYATALMALVAALDAPEDQEEIVYFDQRTGDYVNDPGLLTPPDEFSLYARPRIPELAADDEGWTRVPHGPQW
jgi:hypothetical protein